MGYLLPSNQATCSEAPASEHRVQEAAASRFSMQAGASGQCVPGLEPWNENVCGNGSLLNTLEQLANQSRTQRDRKYIAQQSDCHEDCRNTGRNASFQQLIEL